MRRRVRHHTCKTCSTCKPCTSKTLGAAVRSRRCEPFRRCLLAADTPALEGLLLSFLHPLSRIKLDDREGIVKSIKKGISGCVYLWQLLCLGVAGTFRYSCRGVCDCSRYSCPRIQYFATCLSVSPYDLTASVSKIYLILLFVVLSLSSWLPCWSYVRDSAIRGLKINENI